MCSVVLLISFLLWSIRRFFLPLLPLLTVGQVRSSDQVGLVFILLPVTLSPKVFPFPKGVNAI